ncbi:MAG: DUF3011 domain-containing protein [Luteimonas sp.]|nr:DUF3011 domain-containing protein [Luteimonas sp.]
MNRLLQAALLGLAFAALAPATGAAPPTARAYAPENLRSLSSTDQTRVIAKEYSEQSNGRGIPDDQLRFYLDQVSRSNWGFSQVRQDIARSLGGNNGGSGPGNGWDGNGGANGGSIRCESDSRRPRTCATPWQGNSRLVRQLSDTACVEGRTWQSQRGQVYVSGGCRGEFAASSQPGYPGPGNSYSVTCSSTRGNPQSCAWNSRQGRPYLQRQISSSPCRENDSWWYDGNAIWVKNGCRALFGTR